MGGERVIMMMLPLNVQLAVVGTTAVSLLGFYLLLLWRKEIEQQLIRWQACGKY
jgi:hypothetical protein